MKKNIIFVVKKNFFFNKLSLLLEKEGFVFKKISLVNKDLLKQLNGNLLFFLCESKETISELSNLKNLRAPNLNLIIFKTKDIKIQFAIDTLAYFDLPLSYHDFLIELKKFIEAKKKTHNKFILGKYIFNPITSVLVKENSSIIINLTELESKFLSYMFTKRKGATKSEILSEVWKHNKQLNTHTLESLIYRLRKKIEKNPNKPSILINNTKGYLLNL